MHLAVFHPSANRPDAPQYQSLLTRLLESATSVIRNLGWNLTLIASDGHTIEQHMALLAEADAVLLMGGEDIDPRFYGGRPDYPHSGRHEPVADEAHIAVIKACITGEKPLLGLCRGLQLINVACGGDLIQHMETPASHRRATANDPFITHHVTSVVHESVHPFQAPECPVVCSHHQAIDRLGKNLVVASRAQDGTVETVVHRSAPITGVQWHPEHPDTAQQQLGALLQRLSAQCGA